jgi:hypothetical protein
LLLLVGCAQSLFDSRTVDVDDATCGARCVADAAADFDGTPGGANQNNWRWRYLDDHRDRSWTAMSASGDLEVASAETSNRITTCAAHPDEPACEALPHALLVSTTGGGSQADPAIELTAPARTRTVIQLSVHAFVPSGEAQTIRLYRNSREDVLFTGTATAGVGLQHTIILDALDRDRFLVAVEPTGKGATGVGLHLFASTDPAEFPSSCQLALPFETTTGPVDGIESDTEDLCGKTTATHYDYPTQVTPLPSMFAREPGPFQELGSAASITQNRFLERMGALDWSGDVTLQLWTKLRSVSSDPNRAWLFSDQDPDTGGGFGISIVPGSGNAASLDVTACTDSTARPVQFGDAVIPYPDYTSWHFVRVVRAGGSLSVCMDGLPVMAHPLLSGLPTGLTTSHSPDLGKIDLPATEAYFDGAIDDVRVITGALPCDITAAP